ncbi:MAG TPA: MarR family winged helix-turn-helix transcriptional regulator [Dongiaceae bacterium]|nr:MarR family winged helix-turn-helix transcriptional regulator [Dongiaceae bacterium]
MHMQVNPGLLSHLDLRGTGSCAAFQFRRTARAVTRLYDLALAPSGIRSTQFAILTAVAKFQPLAISRLGELLVLDQTTLTRSLRLLRKQKLLEVSARTTRRQRLVTLTEEGAKAIAAALPLWRNVQEEFLSKTEGRWLELRDELGKLAKASVEIEKRHAGADASE